MHTKLPIISFFQKLIIFLLLDFRRIRKEVSKSGILWSIAWADVIKRFIWFFKVVPFGAPRSLIQMVSKRNGVFIEMDLLPIVITNSFKIQNQIFERHFHFFWLYDHKIYSFLEPSAKFVMIKGIQNKFIHFMQILTSKQSLHFSKGTFTNEHIHNQKTNKNCP